MSMYKDIDWGKRGKIVLRILYELLSLLEDSRRDIGLSRAWIREDMVRNPCQQT